MPFQKGQSGNPGGRKPGTGKVARLRKSIEKEIPDILKALTKAAKDGDTTAARLLLERAVPALKAVDSPVSANVGGTLAEAGERVLRAIGAGDLTPEEGGKLLQGLGALARVEQVAELKARLESLERILQLREKPE